MADFAELLSQKSDIITQKWTEAVCQDRQIETARELTYNAVRDSMPKVLEAMASILSQTETSDVQKLVDASLEHGVVRSEQGYEPAEIAREYRILRSVIFTELEADLVQGSSVDLLRAVRLIDMVIDEAIARCFSSYTQGRLQELEQLQSQLKLTNQELTRLVRTSKANLSQLAHELKTPLTSIIGYSDLFLRQHRQDPTTKDSVTNLESIERVLRGGRLLLRLINDALELSRYDAGAIPLQFALTDVRALMQSMIEIVEPLASAKQLQLQVDCDRAPAEVVTDPLRLQQVVTNLLSNAIRYTETGFVQLVCETRSTEWIITIADSGIGMSDENQKHIFEPYFQVNSIANVEKGTGLGLAIVARLVKLLQGTIHLASQPNVGSTFTVTFPLDASQQQGEE